MEIKTVFLPRYHSNPYQNILARHLELFSVKFEDFGLGVKFSTFYKVLFLQPDIIHFHWIHAFSTDGKSKLGAIKNTLVLFGLIAWVKMFHKKIVWTAHNLHDHEHRNPQLDKSCTRCVIYFADNIITHCHSARKQLLDAYTIANRDKVCVIPHGNYIDYYVNTIGQEEARRNLGLKKDAFIILFLGAIRPYKGVSELIDAFGEIKQSDVKLVIAGATHDKYGELIREKVSVNDDIFYFEGSVPEEDIQVFMNACDVVVFPFRDIFTSGSIILAMSFGKPCIVPNFDVMRETVGNDGAFFYDPQDPYGLARTLEVCINNRERLSDMGRLNLRRAEQLNWTDVAEQTYKAYRS